MCAKAFATGVPQPADAWSHFVRLLLCKTAPYRRGRFKKNKKNAKINAGMKKVFIISLAFLSLFSSCSRIPDSAQDKKERFVHKQASALSSEINSLQVLKEKALDEYVKKTSLHDKVCQLFIENLEGDTVYVPVEKNFIPGGYLFFSYNLADNPLGIMRFTDSIRSYCVKNNVVPPFLAVDQEGGYVNRLRTVAGPLPSALRVSSKMSVAEAYKLYSCQAREIKALGFNMNIAPVVEVQTAENEKFLNGRSFGSFVNVRNYGTACINAFENRGVGAVIKHFPGNTNTDPHTGLPEITLSEKDMEEAVRPFKSLSRIFPSGVLMSHARTSVIDSEIPACFSKVWVTEKLRNDYGYSGIIFSDDIFMGALASNGYPPEEAAVKAIEAGINCIMISEKRISGPAKVLIEKAKKDSDFARLIDESFKKIISYKIKANILAYSKNEDGSLSIVTVSKNESIDFRLSAFNKARDENIDLYQTYF